MKTTAIRLGLAATLIAAALAGVAARQAPAPKKGYIIAEVAVSNADQYAEYAKRTPAIVEQYGGRFIARGGQVATLEGAAAADRVVIIEFPSFDRAKAYFESADYQAARKFRLGAANFRGVLVEGL